jgi:hypothetical protein
VKKLRDRTKHAFEIVRVSNERSNVLIVELLREYFELRSRRDQNYLRAQRDDCFETRLQRIADFRDSLCFGWVVAVTRISDETISSADRKNDLRQARGQRNNAIDASGKRHSPTGIVCDFSGCGWGFRAGPAGVARASERHADQEQRADGCGFEKMC